jgi:hypothetical protein
VIEQFPAGGIAGRIHDAVDRAFLDGLQVGSLVCAGIALSAAAVVAILLPSRARQSKVAAEGIGLPEPGEVAA